MKNRNFIKYWLLVIGFWILVNHFPCSMLHLASSVAADNKKTSRSSLDNTTDQNGRPKRQLWLAKLNMAEDEKDETTKNELQRMIEQIRSVNFEFQKEAFETVIVPDVVPIVVPIDDPNEAAAEDAREQYKKEEESNLSNGLVTNQTLQTIRDLSQDPSNLHNPFELGETLFLSGYLKEAAKFYQEALKRKTPDDAGAARDRAWILFQIGNCLRNNDQPEAIKMYGQLITEYPDSPWKELAEARRTLLSWFLKDEPHKLIAERTRDYQVAVVQSK
ncbi:MAG: tetratricopeptide repeat protein [Planctomycetes bacterium]|nr:tetratricopeptide repeat protein [Planctomycetota bacterium]